MRRLCSQGPGSTFKGPGPLAAGAHSTSLPLDPPSLSRLHTCKDAIAAYAPCHRRLAHPPSAARPPMTRDYKLQYDSQLTYQQITGRLRLIRKWEVCAGGGWVGVGVCV